MLEYQTAVMRRDFDTADRILKTIPESQATRVAQFLEKQASLKIKKLTIIVQIVDKTTRGAVTIQ